MVPEGNYIQSGKYTRCPASKEVTAKLSGYCSCNVKNQTAPPPPPPSPPPPEKLCKDVDSGKMMPCSKALCQDKDYGKVIPYVGSPPPVGSDASATTPWKATLCWLTVFVAGIVAA